MPRVDPEFIVHKFNVDPLYPPKKQKLRRSAKGTSMLLGKKLED